MLFGYNVGNWFAFAMVALASVSIFYSTSNVLHRYRTDQHVAASLSLFASVVLLFWYIVQILLLQSRRELMKVVLDRLITQEPSELSSEPLLVSGERRGVSPTCPALMR